MPDSKEKTLWRKIIESRVSLVYQYNIQHEINVNRHMNKLKNLTHCLEKRNICYTKTNQMLELIGNFKITINNVRESIENIRYNR